MLHSSCLLCVTAQQDEQENLCCFHFLLAIANTVQVSHAMLDLNYLQLIIYEIQGQYSVSMPQVLIMTFCKNDFSTFIENMWLIDTHKNSILCLESHNYA